MTEKSRPRGLGRGLNALFDDDEGLPIVPESSDDSAIDLEDNQAKHFLGVEQLEAGSSQPRLDFDTEALEALASSIKIHGILQPLLVRAKVDASSGEIIADQFEIIAGERRWRAAQLAQLHEVPVIIKELENEQALQIALIENLQREDLNPVEEALAYQRLIQEHDYTQAKLADVLGKSRSHIANMTRMLVLPQVVLNSVREGELSTGHARCLIPADRPEELAKHIIKEGLSVRATEKWVQKISKPKETVVEDNDPLASSLSHLNNLVEEGDVKDPDLLALEKELSANIGMNVCVNMRKGSDAEGALVIDFKSLDQLDALLRLLSGFEQQDDLPIVNENQNIDDSLYEETSLEDEIRNLITQVGDDINTAEPDEEAIAQKHRLLD